MPELWPGIAVILIIGALFVPSIGVVFGGIMLAAVGFIGMALAILYGLLLSCREAIGCLFGRPRPPREVTLGLP